MRLGTLGLIAFIVFLAALAGLAERARRARRDDTPADHFLAGRDLGMVVLFFTLYATQYSGNSLLGFPGEAYRRGFSWVMCAGFMIAVVAVYLLFVPRLRVLAVCEGFVTPGDFLRFRFGSRRLVVAVAVIQLVALTNFLAAQLMAMGHVAVGLTEGTVPYALGVVGLAAVILVYETVGGMRAVAWTDVLQGLLILVGLAGLLAWLLLERGGLGGITTWLLAHRPATVVVPSRAECANWASSILLMGFGSAVYPQALQRVYAARTAQGLRRALALMALMPLVTVLVTMLIGLGAIVHLGALDGIAADEVVPRLLRQMLEHRPTAAPLAVAVLIGALAAITSTADSVLLSVGSLIAEDLLGGASTSARTTRIGKWVAAALLAGTLVVALVPRLTLWRMVELKMELLIQCVPAIVLAIRCRGLRERGVFAGLLVGCALAASGTLAGVPRIAGVHTGVLALAANVAMAVVMSRSAARLPAGGREAPLAGAGDDA